MQRIILNKVGPIDTCDLPIDNFTVLTGPQASGKSTIAKSIAFFRTVKDDICDSIIKRATTNISKTLYATVQQTLRNKFLQIFGSSRAMDDSMQMKFCYSDSTFIRIYLQLVQGVDFIAPNYIKFEFSKDIVNYLNRTSIFISREQTMKELSELFHDDSETIFIPAGRSLITLLTTQLNYIFTSMDEEQKRSIDFCTQKYIERILRIRPSLSYGIDEYIKTHNVKSHQLRECINLSKEVIKGDYRYINGEERLYINDNHFVKINFTSSGQQETVWLINILLYQLINKTNTFVIIEEPEAHLYPNAQKLITEIITTFISEYNSALITTHSPYVLGTINNALYASQIQNNKPDLRKDVENIVAPSLWVNQCNAYFVNNAIVSDCTENDSPLIANEVIEGTSRDINADYDSLFLLETR